MNGRAQGAAVWAIALVVCGCGGPGAPVVPVCAVTPAHLEFDANHPTRTFVLHNSGRRRITGTVESYGDFHVNETYDLGPGGKDTISVRFGPRSVGPLSAAIQTGCSQEVICEGTGVIVHRQLAARCDTYTTWAEPDRNFAEDPTLAVGVLGPTPPTGFERAVIRFDLSTLIPHHAATALVSLQQIGCDPAAAALQMVCGATRDPVDCTTVTASTLRDIFYTIDTVRSVECSAGSVAFDVTSIVNGHLSGLFDVRAFVVTPYESAPAPTRHRFESMESLHPPVLIVDLVVPG